MFQPFGQGACSGTFRAAPARAPGHLRPGTVFVAHPASFCRRPDTHRRTSELMRKGFQKRIRGSTILGRLLIFPARMKSMTGYGWGECSQNGFKVTVELSSVNRKQSELSISLPRELEVLEAQVRDEINKRVARGRLTTRVTLQTAEGKDSGRVQVNRALAASYVRELRKLAAELHLQDNLTLELL